MTDIGVATRVHGRADDNLVYYRLYRNIWYHGRPDIDLLREALVARSRWSALREIIDAEERRAKQPNCAFDGDVNAFDADHFIDRVPA